MSFRSSIWIVCCLAFIGCTKKESSITALTLVYTSNVLGEVEPCGCVYRPMWGLSRKKKLIDQERAQQKKLLVLDSGDLFFSARFAPEHLRKQWELQADFIVDQFNFIETDAISVGELDLALGVETLKKLEAKSKFSWVNSNLVDATTQKPIFTPSIVKEVGNLKVGIFGLMGVHPDSPEITMLDPETTAQKIVKKLSGEAQFIILLSHQGWAKDIELAKKVLGIDVIISGH